MFDIPEHTIARCLPQPMTGLLTRGAIASCLFPLAEAPDKPGPVARPALVVRVFRDRTTGDWMAVVAYGTKQMTGANRGREVRIFRPESLRVAGLHEPTRFILARMRILPIGPHFFAYRQGWGPVLGHLDEALQRRLDAACEQISGLVGDENFRPFLVATDLAIAPLSVPYLAGGTITDPAAHVLRSEPSDAFLQRYFTGRSDLARRLSKRSGLPAPGLVR